MIQPLQSGETRSRTGVEFVVHCNNNVGRRPSRCCLKSARASQREARPPNPFAGVSRRSMAIKVGRFATTRTGGSTAREKRGRGTRIMSKAAKYSAIELLRNGRALENTRPRAGRPGRPPRSGRSQQPAVSLSPLLLPKAKLHGGRSHVFHDRRLREPRGACRRGGGGRVARDRWRCTLHRGEARQRGNGSRRCRPIPGTGHRSAAAAPPGRDCPGRRDRGVDGGGPVGQHFEKSGYRLGTEREAEVVHLTLRLL
jgi:hypothetical protein